MNKRMDQPTIASKPPLDYPTYYKKSLMPRSRSSSIQEQYSQLLLSVMPKGRSRPSSVNTRIRNELSPVITPIELFKVKQKERRHGTDQSLITANFKLNNRHTARRQKRQANHFQHQSFMDKLIRQNQRLSKKAGYFQYLCLSFQRQRVKSLRQQQDLLGEVVYLKKMIQFGLKPI